MDIIIFLGTGFIAGSPIAKGKPGFVTIPIPFPALNIIPVPALLNSTLDSINALWVTSGSSPASLIIPADAEEYSKEPVSYTHLRAHET